MPLAQALSLKAGCRQAVPWSEPSSRYLQAALVGMSVAAGLAAAQVAKASTAANRNHGLRVASPAVAAFVRTRLNALPTPAQARAGVIFP
jgi:hypothetical protein